MSDDPPPPYTAIDDTKINQLPAQLPGPGTFSQLAGQPQLLHVYPSAPPGYETVAYYPAPSSADAAVLLQPQPVQVVTNVQVVQSDSTDQDAIQSNTYSTDVCILCCMCLCCCCPCFVVSFM